MQKKLLSGDEARKMLIHGINQMADTIKATLGPKGRNVVIANAYTGPYMTNDGATIAREFMLEDTFENVGIDLVKEVALKTNDLAGDGTTTATLLAQKMIKEGMDYVEQGYSPVYIKEGIKKAVDVAVNHLEQSCVKIETINQIRNVACISSGEYAIGEIIAQAIEQIGKDALISIEESKNAKTELEVVSGYRIEEGYISPYLLSDQVKMVTDFKDPYFLITNEKITNINQILAILENVMEHNGNLVILSDTIHEDIVSTLVLNKLQNTLHVVAVKAPSTHDNRREVLEDIAIVTGGKVIGTELGIPLEQASMEDLGRAKQVKVYKDTTIIIEGNAKQQELEDKLNQIKHLLDGSQSDFEQDRLRERLANLSTSAAIIKVGGLSELEMKEKKMKIEDALCATRAAIKEGILAGGGVAYLNTATYLKDVSKTTEKEELIGFTIVIEALQEPIKQLLINAGIQDVQTIFEKIESLAPMVGYNIDNSTFINMFEAGIIDPTTVEKVALQSASSIASLILTTESVLVDVSNESLIKKDLNEQLLNHSDAGLF